jgi:hypothetical protein
MVLGSGTQAQDQQIAEILRRCSPPRQPWGTTVLGRVYAEHKLNLPSLRNFINGHPVSVSAQQNYSFNLSPMS